MAMSSIHRARWGYRSDTSIPDLPALVNFRREASRVPGLRAFNRGSLWTLGIGCPCRRVSSGLGSQVSTWLTPPYMNRQMHALAFGGKWGFLAASGDFGDSAAPALAGPVKKPSAA